MDHVQFCADLFPIGVRKLLIHFKYDDLPLESVILDSATLYLIKKCADTFFHEKKDIESDVVYAKVPECLEAVKALLDLTWERLNTGCWKDVNLVWRYVYSYASLFKVLCLLLDKDCDKKEIIKVCDIGFMMGAPILDNVLSKITSEIMSEDQQKTALDEISDSPSEPKKLKTSVITINPAYQVETRNWISCIEFEESFIKTNTPILLLSVIPHWPAIYNKWSVEYILTKARHRTVPVEIGSKYTDDSWSQKLMTVEEFVKKYIWKEDGCTEVGYLAQHNLFDQIPELKDDISIPLYIKDQFLDKVDVDLDKEVDINAWFGPENTVSPLHYDPKNNFLVQLMGEKYVRLYSQEQTPYLYPREGTIFDNTSMVDVENPDLDSFPLFSKAKYTECVLKPGYMLYIPPKCWHYVRSLSVSFSVSYWW